MRERPRTFLRIGFAWLLLTCAPAGAAICPAGGQGGEATPAPARRVLVVARIQEEAKRRALEEEARLSLKKRGVEAMLGSDVMTEADFASEESIRGKVESLGVDGVLGFVVLRIEESQKTSSASLSVGVGGYGGGGFGMFVGGTVPLGAKTTIVRRVQLRARFWTRPFSAPAWENVYDEKLEADTTWLTQYIAHDSVTTLKKKKLVPAK